MLSQCWESFSASWFLFASPVKYLRVPLVIIKLVSLSNRKCKIHTTLLKLKVSDKVCVLWVRHLLRLPRSAAGRLSAGMVCTSHAQGLSQSGLWRWFEIECRRLGAVPYERGDSRCREELRAASQNVAVKTVCFQIME